MNWKWVKRNETYTRIMPIIHKVMSGTSKVAGELYDHVPEYRPFHDNEAAAVSLLVAGAARSGLAPVAEYPVDKKTWKAVRKKFHEPLSKLEKKHVMRGRADLTVSDGERFYSFEFKRSSERPWRKLGARGLRSNLDWIHSYAIEEIGRVDDQEYQHVMAGLIVPVFDNRDEALFLEFAEECNLAVSLGSRDKYKVYLYFSSLSKYGKV